jgi:hypothetical protein
VADSEADSDGTRIPTRSLNLNIGDVLRFLEDGLMYVKSGPLVFRAGRVLAGEPPFWRPHLFKLGAEPINAETITPYLYLMQESEDADEIELDPDCKFEIRGSKITFLDGSGWMIYSLQGKRMRLHMQMYSLEKQNGRIVDSISNGVLPDKPPGNFQGKHTAPEGSKWQIRFQTEKKQREEQWKEARLQEPHMLKKAGALFSKKGPFPEARVITDAEKQGMHNKGKAAQAAEFVSKADSIAFPTAHDVVDAGEHGGQHVGAPVQAADFASQAAVAFSAGNEAVVVA